MRTIAVIESLEKDLHYYEKLLENNISNIMENPIIEEIEFIKQKINWIIFREKFEKKK